MLDYNTYRQEQLRNLSQPMTANEMETLNNNLQNGYRKYVMQQNNGVLTETDLQNINKMMKPKNFEMPTYGDIYNSILGMLGK